MAYMRLLLFVGVFSIISANVEAFICADELCIVNCSSTETCSNTVINGANSRLLKVICNGAKSPCNHLDIMCPQNANGSECKLTCNGNHGCTNINFYPLDSNTFIHCGNTPNIRSENSTMSICVNLTISPPHNRAIYLPSIPLNKTHNITLNCTAVVEESPSSPTCSNVTFSNMGYIPSQTLSVICDSADFISSTSANAACFNFTLQHDDIHSNYFEITSIAVHTYFRMHYLNIRNLSVNSFVLNNYNEISHVYIASQSIHSLNIYNHHKAHMQHMRIQHAVSALINNGTISDTEMHQFENITIGSFGQLYKCNISSMNMRNIMNISGLVHDCVLRLNHDIHHINNTLLLFHNGLFANNTFYIHAHSDMIVNGAFENNTINLMKTEDDIDFMNIMKLNLNASSSWINNTIHAYYTELLNITTLSLFSGSIFTNDTCNNFSLRCENKADVENTCRNLTLYTSPSYTDGARVNDVYYNYATYLECIAYGCQYISIWSLNGLNDVHFAATECPCSVDCIDSCMGEWNIYCSNKSHALFTDDECEPYECCGDIINQSAPYFMCSPTLYQNVVCTHSVGLDIALIASLSMAGIILVFFVYLGFRFMYRKIRKDEMQKELERKRQMEEDKKKSKKHKKKTHKLMTQEPLLADTENIE